MGNGNGSLRSTFLPDEGCVFLRVDLSQAEDRVCKMWTRHKDMIEMANLKPWEFDCHTHNASRIFHVDEKSVTKEMRYLGKVATHASQRGLGGQTLSESLLKDGKIVSKEECRRMITAYLDDHWQIRDIFFPYIRGLVMRDRMLVNTWGRRWYCVHDRLNDDLYRKAYSFPMQSEVAEIINKWGFRPLWDWLKVEGKYSRINLQVHDELIVSCPPDELYDVAKFLVSSLEQPRMHFGASLVIPAEVTVGGTWADKRYEWKKFPEREEMEEVAQTILNEVSG